MIKLLMLMSLLYSGSEFARVGDLRGNARIWRYGDEGYEWLTINNIIGEGDEIETFEDTYLSVEFSDGSVMSVGENTNLSIDRIEEDRAYINLMNGTVRIFARDRIFGVFTEGEDVYVEENSIIRVEKDEGYFAIRVHKGYAKVNREPLYAGMEYVRDRGRVYTGRTGRPDIFDRWAEEREREYYVVERVEYIPVPYYAGVPHLRRFGRWVYVPPYGWVWVPKVRRGWRPYVDGHWVYRVGIGWVWVPYEPWGWVPYHYGNWTYVYGYGWVWVPSGTFAGAWVEWYYGPDWIGWAPVDYYGRPIIVVNNVTVINVIKKEDFVKPVYRYKPPKGPVYKEAVYKPVTNVNVKEVTKYKAVPDKPINVKDVELKDKKTLNPPADKQETFKEKPSHFQRNELEGKGIERPEKPYVKPKGRVDAELKDGDLKPERPIYKKDEKNLGTQKESKTQDKEEDLKPQRPVYQGDREKDIEIKPERPAYRSWDRSTRIETEGKDADRTDLKPEKPINSANKDQEENLKPERPIYKRDSGRELRLERKELIGGEHKPEIKSSGSEIKVLPSQKTEREGSDENFKKGIEKKVKPTETKKLESKEEKEDNNKPLDLQKGAIR